MIVVVPTAVSVGIVVDFVGYFVGYGLCASERCGIGGCGSHDAEVYVCVTGHVGTAAAVGMVDVNVADVGCCLGGSGVCVDGGSNGVEVYGDVYGVKETSSGAVSLDDGEVVDETIGRSQ